MIDKSYMMQLKQHRPVKFLEALPYFIAQHFTAYLGSLGVNTKPLVEEHSKKISSITRSSINFRNLLIGGVIYLAGNRLLKSLDMADRLEFNKHMDGGSRDKNTGI